MGGIILDQALPVSGIDQIDPFILIHHWKHTYSGGDKQSNLGVGPHPHRGFSPVTVIFEGGVHHRDSRGNNSKIYAGGTQWMNAGMGIVHSERPVKEIAENGGTFELVQFWVNNPAKFKMDQPSYQPLSRENTVSILSPDKLIRVNLIAGNLSGNQSPIQTCSPLLILTLEIGQDGKITLPVPKEFNSLLYLLNGKIKCNDNFIQEKEIAWFNNDGDKINFHGVENSVAILLAGMPIGEEVSSYGPFVMNTTTQIMQAMADYQRGKMGVLIEEFD